MVTYSLILTTLISSLLFYINGSNDNAIWCIFIGGVIFSMQHLIVKLWNVYEIYLSSKM